MKNRSSTMRTVRLLLISRIMIVLFAIGIALILWQHNSSTLLHSIEKLSVENPNIELVEGGITSLYQAENNFRYYLTTYDRNSFIEYSENLQTVSAIIDTLQHSLKMSGDLGEINVTLGRKSSIAASVIRLKMLTDSLLVVAGQWDTSSLRSAQLPVFDIRKIQNLSKKSSVDSIIDTASVTKQGFFKKVKKLFRDDSTPQSKSIIVKHTEELKDSNVETNIKSTPEYALLQDIQAYYTDKISTFSDGRNRLDSQEKVLAGVNEQLIGEIANILFMIKQSELENARSVRDQAIVSGEKSARTISVIAVVSVLIASIFYFLTIFNLRKIQEGAVKLENEKLKAENLSLQKTRFLSGMSHEIRAPLNNVLGFAEQLRNAPHENHNIYLEAITVSAELMLSTVNQILDFSKLEAGKMQFSVDTFSPYKAIQAAAGTMMLRAKEKNIRMDIHLAFGQDLIVSGDEFRLKQIIVNLLDNALKYTDNGEINIRTTVITSNDGFRIFVEVADTGMGIPPEKVDAIFNEFERLEENENRHWKPGTGLGLPIARKVVEQQGGKIYVKATSAKGSVFAFELPYAKPEESIQASSVPKPKIPPSKTILLADDDDFSVLLITTLCKKHNINVVSAKNGQVAYDLALTNHIDLILTDINMPVLSGLDFTRKLRDTPKIASIPVIAVTANVMNDDVNLMNEAGFSEILFKPFRETDFIQKISLFLQ